MFDSANEVGKAALPSVELYPEALEVLRKLKEMGKKTALITSSNRENVHHLLEKYEMYPLFDAVVTREDSKEQKPHPESLLIALDLLQGNLAEAIMIGDSDKDIGAAKNAGVDSILFYPEEHAKFYDFETLKSHGPTYIVNNFRDVISIV